MLEGQLCCMQSQASNWIGPASVGAVTRNRMPLFRQMHSNLVLAAGFKLHLDEGPVCQALQDLDVCHGPFPFAAIMGGVATVHSILSQVRLDDLLIPSHVTFRNCQVSPGSGVLFELLLQLMLCGFRLGEDQ